MSQSLSVCIVATALVCLGCHKIYTLDPVDGGTGDGVSDTGTSTSADADADSDSDTDSDTDTDSDSGTYTDGATDSDTDPFDCAGGRYDESNDLCWQHPSAGGPYNWQEATDYCDSLEVAGNSDWYLPDRDDFTVLLGGCDSNVSSGREGYCNSCIESETCSALFGADFDWYWSSSVNVVNSNGAWEVAFDGSFVHSGAKTNYNTVRCVRRGQ